MQNRGAGPAKDRLIRLIEEIRAKNSITGPVAADDELARVGLTSIDMVALMLAIEAEFDVMIPASEITPANFRSISTIEVMIARIISRATRP